MPEWPKITGSEHVKPAMIMGAYFFNLDFGNLGDFGNSLSTVHQW
jgi:hypothetical protein